MVAVWAASESGLAISADSTVYVEAARSITAGHGLLAQNVSDEPLPVTHWPALFPLLIAIADRLCGDLVTGVRVLNAFAHGATSALMGWSAWRLTANRFACGLAATGTALHPVLIEMGQSLLSETVFICLVAWAGALLLSELSLPTRGSLFLLSVACGLSALQRYAGFFLWIACIVTIGRWGQGAIIARLKRVALFLAVASILPGINLIRNFVEAGTMTDRSMERMAFRIPDFRGAAGVVAFWLIEPGQTRSLRIVVLFLALVFAIAACSWAIAAESVKRPRTMALMVLGFSYLSLLVTTASAIDALTPFDSRTLSPLAPLFLLLVTAWSFDRLPGNRFLRPLHILGRTALTALVVSYACRQESGVDSLRFQKGYAGERWARSPTIEALREMNPSRVWSNRAEAVRFVLPGRVSFLPLLFDPRAGPSSPNQALREQSAAGRKQMCESGAVVALFDEGWDFQPRAGQAVREMGLMVVRDTDDGLLARATTPCRGETSLF